MYLCDHNCIWSQSVSSHQSWIFVVSVLTHAIPLADECKWWAHAPHLQWQLNMMPQPAYTHPFSLYGVMQRPRESELLTLVLNKAEQESEVEEIKKNKGRITMCNFFFLHVFKFQNTRNLDIQHTGCIAHILQLLPEVCNIFLMMS